MVTATAQLCASCAAEPRGPGGVLGDACRERIAAVLANYWQRYEVGTGRDAGRVIPRRTNLPAAATN